VTRRAAAATTLVVFAAAIGLALLPFSLGIIGAPILAVTFAPMHEALRRRMGGRSAAIVVVCVGIVAIVLPAIGFSLLLVNELPGVLGSEALRRFTAQLEAVRLGPLAIGEQLATASSDLAAWTSRQLMLFVGGLTFVVINLFIAFLGLYFFLRLEVDAWQVAGRYLPFSAATLEKLRHRFHDVTRATIIGIGATAVVQGTVVGGAFALVGLGHPVLWGAVTGLASVLPVFGTSLIWLPGSAVLFVQHQYTNAIVLLLIGILIASNVDNVIRPIVFRRVSHVHPLVAVVGAFAGMRWFGLVGLLLGPLVLVYFIELLRAYDHDFRPGERRPGISAPTWPALTASEDSCD
jgi:predicted PurR-regulated permease PerM